MEEYKKILIIEDDLILALSIEMMLKKIGFTEIKKTGTGEDAILLSDSFDPDLMLVDIQLGAGITGIEAVRKIQVKKNIPALYITGNSDKYYRSLADETHFLDYLIKPITYRELKDAIYAHV